MGGRFCELCRAPPVMLNLTSAGHGPRSPAGGAWTVGGQRPSVALSYTRQLCLFPWINRAERRGKTWWETGQGRSWQGSEKAATQPCGEERPPAGRLAPQVGLEPTTLRLTAECSAD